MSLYTYCEVIKYGSTSPFYKQSNYYIQFKVLLIGYYVLFMNIKIHRMIIYLIVVALYSITFNY